VTSVPQVIVMPEHETFPGQIPQIGVQSLCLRGGVLVHDRKSHLPDGILVLNHLHGLEPVAVVPVHKPYIRLAGRHRRVFINIQDQGGR